MNEAERAEWHTNRRKGVCGTDIAAILGLSSYAGPLDVYMDKKGISTPKIETPQMLWGKKLEPVIRRRYEEETGFTVFQPGFLVNPLTPLIAGTPDGVVLNPEGGYGHVLEIKTSRTAQGWGEAGTDQIPQAYLLQTAWYMALCDCDRADVAVLIGGSDFRIYHLTRDLELERYLIETATAWWQEHITEDTPPEIDGSDGAGRYLAYKYPHNAEPLKEATEEVNELLLNYRKAKARIADEELHKGALENKIKEFIGYSDGVQGTYRATWKNTKDVPKTDWEAVAKEALAPCHPKIVESIVARHTVTKPGTRRFLFTGKEEE